jgi:adenine deaminase
VHDLVLTIPSGRARVIAMSVGSLVTKNTRSKCTPDAKGRFLPIAGEDLLKLVVVERHKGSGRIGLGIVEGYGLKGGAAAGSIAHDSHNLIAVGDDDEATRRFEALATSGGVCPWPPRAETCWECSPFLWAA